MQITLHWIKWFKYKLLFMLPLYLHMQQQLHSYQSMKYYNVLSPNSVHAGVS